MLNKTETKTIVLHTETYEKLLKMKQHPRQSFNEIIWNSINELKIIKELEQMNDQLKEVDWTFRKL